MSWGRKGGKIVGEKKENRNKRKVQIVRSGWRAAVLFYFFRIKFVFLKGCATSSTNVYTARLVCVEKKKLCEFCCGGTI